MSAFVLWGLVAAMPGEVALELVAKLDVAPGNIAVTPDGRIILSLMQFFDPKQAVVELRPDGTLEPFPNAEWNRRDGRDRPTLDTVLGLRCDGNGVVWMLDNGLRGKSVPKLVGWDTRRGRLASVIHLPPPATVKESFLNDLAVDLTHAAIYIADPAGPASAALVVVDLQTGLARRVLQGHVSVVPENVDLVIDGKALQTPGANGKPAPVRVGVNPIALDSADQWLYFGPMSGRSLYRVRTADLLDPALPPEELAAGVERYSEKPVCDGISMDTAGHIYITDVGANAIGVIGPDRQYRLLVKDEVQLCWPDAFSFGPDGFFYVVANQLHRSPALNSGRNLSKPPFYVLRFAALAPGVVGR